MTPPTRRPSVLVTNDDGIYAAGLRSLVSALAPHADVYVSSPSGGAWDGVCVMRWLSLVKWDGPKVCSRPLFPPSLPPTERSALSQAITMRRHFAVFPIDVPGAIEAYAVDGTPADSTMVGLNAPVWRSATANSAAALADPGADGAPRTFDVVVSGINAGDNAGYHAW